MDKYIERNLFQIRNEIEKVEAAANRNSDSVKLIAVSKNFPVEDIFQAYSVGQRLFGENKIQELENKAPKLPNDIEWHLIGHLQSNKVAKAVELAEYIHSVDSEKLIQRIDKIASEKNKIQKILLEVNVSEEESKFGLKLSELESCVEFALKCNNLELAGLMTMAPFDISENELNNIFSALKAKRDELELKFKIKLPELSMGMSGDFKAAIANGSTMVRIGTAIFGNRNAGE